MAKKMSEEDILTRVNAKVRACVSWPESKIGKEREKVIKYYEQKEPARQHAGNSSYVSSDVYDAVEMMKAQLLETFAGGHEIARFDPLDLTDVMAAQLETRCVEEVVFSDNDGFGLFYDIIHDGLTGRNAIASVYWDEDYSYETHELDSTPHMDVQGLVAQDDVTEVDATHDEGSHPAAPTYSGSYTQRTDKCKVCVEAVAPEEFFLESRVKRLSDGVRGRRTLKTKAELLAMGLDKTKVEKINWDDKTALDTAERLAREEATDNGSTLGMEAAQDELQHVLLYVTYMKLALKGPGSTALYRILHADSVLFEYDEVEEDEFVDWAALRRPHTWWGNNFAHRVIPTQNARTVLTRGVLDHTAITTNPRWQVVQGALLNPREMIDQRIGGLVNVTRPDGVAPLQYPNLNPFVFETLKLLQDNKEENTGISSLSQGLNKDAISNQNSQGMVGDLVALSQVRQKIVARGFANWFLVPLYLKVHRCLTANCKKPRTMEYGGQFVQVDPRQWRERTAISVSLHLGYGEQEKEAAKYVQLYQQLSADQGAAPFFSPAKRYKLLTDAMRKNGFANFNDYLEPPEKAAPPPQPDPIDMMKAQAAKTTADAAMANSQAANKKADANAAAEQQRLEIDRAQTQGTIEKQHRDADRQDLDVANRIDVSQREIDLAEKVPPANQRGIFSANG